MIRDPIETARSGSGPPTSRELVRMSCACLSVSFLMFHQMLARNGHRCVVTGIYNEGSFNCCPQRKWKGILRVPLEVAHILNESLTQDIDPDISKDISIVPVNKVPFRQCQQSPLLYSPLFRLIIIATGAMAILQSFGYQDLANALMTPGGVHAVCSMVMLDPITYYYFDKFKLWFEQTEKVRYLEAC